jgi:hypothetical protein
MRKSMTWVFALCALVAGDKKRLLGPAKLTNLDKRKYEK